MEDSKSAGKNALPAPRFAFAEPKQARKSIADRLRMTLPLEELLGMNLFAKIGIVMLVLGFAFLGQYAFTAMGPGARVALIYAAGAVMLGAGIRFESKDRYRLVARAGIGGGWAMLFFTTYAMNHVSVMAVLGSNIIDCILMLVVAAGMVAHTLRYRSQVVTGLAFLLAFSTVALSQDSIYALAAGVILAIGIAAIALRMNWYELEVFGILASYGNHFYWLYKLYPDGFAGRHFPEFWASVMILLCYWAIFRVSYIARKIKSPRDEKDIYRFRSAEYLFYLGARDEVSIHATRAGLLCAAGTGRCGVHPRPASPSRVAAALPSRCLRSSAVFLSLRPCPSSSAATTLLSSG